MEFEEISRLIVCPVCKTNSPKAWSHWLNKKDKKLVSEVAFQCLTCYESVKVLDKKLLERAVQELHHDEYD